jgi:hypothetical protein
MNTGRAEDDDRIAMRAQWGGILVRHYEPGGGQLIALAENQCDPTSILD